MTKMTGRGSFVMLSSFGCKNSELCVNVAHDLVYVLTLSFRVLSCLNNENESLFKRFAFSIL